jgi:hypothetical protein
LKRDGCAAAGTDGRSGEPRTEEYGTGVVCMGPRCTVEDGAGVVREARIPG